MRLPRDVLSETKTRLTEATKDSKDDNIARWRTALIDRPLWERAFLPFEVCGVEPEEGNPPYLCLFTKETKIEFDTRVGGE